MDTGFLRTLVGYNTRRAALSIIAVFMERMAVYDLKVVDFSVLSLVAHNRASPSRQLCATLSVLPPNMVGLIAALERRGLIEHAPPERWACHGRAPDARRVELTRRPSRRPRNWKKTPPTA